MHAFPIETMPPLVRDFASYKLTIQGCSQKTVDEYLSDLRLFFKYVYAKRYSIAVPSEMFEKLDISRLNTEFICSVTTEEIYDFFVYVSTERRNTPGWWRSRSRAVENPTAFSQNPMKRFQTLTSRNPVLVRRRTENRTFEVRKSILRSTKTRRYIEIQRLK